MDRLMEANQYASLMRQRENLKPIPVPTNAADPVPLPRMLEVALRSAAKPNGFARRRSQAAERPNFPQPGLAKLTGTSKWLQSRSLAISLRSAARPIPAPAAAATRIRLALEPVRTPRPVGQVPSRGLELRVSMGSGFRVRKPGLRDLHLPPPPVRLGAPGAAGKRYVSDIRHEPLTLSLQPLFPVRGAARPEVTLPEPAVKMEWPGSILHMPRRRGIDSNAVDVRTDWRSIRERAVALRRRNAEPVGLPQKPAMRIFAVATPPSAGLADPRSATVSFTPAEPVFGYSNEDLEKR
jgi:hypothetical protein